MLLAAPARGASSACSRAALGCSRSPLLPHAPGSRRLPLPAAPGGSRLLPIASGWCPVVFAASARPIPEAEHVHNFTPAWGAAVQMRCYGVEALRARCAICSDTRAKYAVDSVHARQAGLATAYVQQGDQEGHGGTPGRSEKPGTQPGHPRPAGLLRRLSKNPLSDNHTCDFGLSPWLLGNQSNTKSNKIIQT